MWQICNASRSVVTELKTINTFIRLKIKLTLSTVMLLKAARAVFDSEISSCNARLYLLFFRSMKTSILKVVR